MAKVEETVLVVIVQLTFILDDVSLFLHVQSFFFVLAFSFVFQLSEESLVGTTRVKLQ